ncbi:MAG: hypothetical protein EBZ53_06975 [Verrucomicrobia bacterium]|nr:hypothetical protein [Verrucomicrobiota bacterium]
MCFCCILGNREFFILRKRRCSKNIELVKSSVIELNATVLTILRLYFLVVCFLISIPTIAIHKITTRSDTEVNQIHGRELIFYRLQKNFCITREVIISQSRINPTSLTITNCSAIVLRMTDVRFTIILFTFNRYSILISLTISQKDNIDLLKFILCLKIRNQRMKSNDTFTNRRTRQVKMRRNSTRPFLIRIASNPNVLKLFFKNTIVGLAGEEIHQTERGFRCKNTSNFFINRRMIGLQFHIRIAIQRESINLKRNIHLTAEPNEIQQLLISIQNEFIH